MNDHPDEFHRLFGGKNVVFNYPPPVAGKDQEVLVSHPGEEGGRANG